jgi:DNA helicase-2/ATP-dependent DNA helicase PcrA
MSPQDIGYFAFTRKAAHEARDRAVARFNLDPEKDFLYFRTLHSLAFKALGMSSAAVLGESGLRDFGQRVGVDLMSSGAERVSDDGFSAPKANHPIMRAIDLARNSMLGYRSAYNMVGLPIPFYEFDHLAKEYQRFKQLNGLLDFTDMMVDMSNQPGCVPSLHTVFLDEAQDLTPLQWRVAHILDEKSSRMFLAGDDDQGIYRWSGADPSRFVSLGGGSEVLSQSYRIPRSVHRIAHSVVQRIHRRQKKVWLPRDEEGSVRRTFDAGEVPFGDNEWLVMAQANYMLDGLSDHLTSSGQYFERKGVSSLPKVVRDAIGSWNHILEDPRHEISLREAINLYHHISSGPGRLKRGAKKLLSGSDENDLFTMSLLRERFGLESSPDWAWDEALDRITRKDRTYASALLNRGVNIFQKPRIKLSTIHGAKGGEADNVLLFMDLSGKALRDMENHPDDAHRVLYVGVTRARQNLILKMAEDTARGWTI